MTLDGKNAVVLGASVKGGTGWAIAEALAREGARVAVGARSAGPLQELADAIGGVAIPCDASDPDSIANFIRTAAERLGPIDIAINSAGQTAHGVIAEIDPAVVQRSLDIHYIGNVHFIREATQVMPDGGAIVLISSAAAAQPVVDRFAYACAKAAMDCLVRHAAVEFGRRGIRVNSILPGPIETPLLAPVLERPGARAAFVKEVPLGRVATPEEVADVVVFLCSSRASGVTGTVVDVTAGAHLNNLW